MSEHPQNPDVLPESIGSPSSILDERDIQEAFNFGSHYLISEASRKIENIRQSSYELRVSNKYCLLKFTQEERNNLRGIAHEDYYVPADGGLIQIYPGQTVKLFTEEKLCIPKNVLARVNTRGQIFESGLAAENTYVDPGFGLQAAEPIHITVSNVSNKVIKIPVGVKLARIEFLAIMHLTTPLDWRISSYV